MNLTFVCFRNWNASERSRVGCFQWRSLPTGRTWTRWRPPPCALARTTIGARNITSTLASSPAESTPRMLCGRTAVTACDHCPGRKTTGAVIWSSLIAPTRLKSKTVPRSTFTIGSCSQSKSWSSLKVKVRLRAPVLVFASQTVICRIIACTVPKLYDRIKLQ